MWSYKILIIVKRECRGKIFWNLRSKAIILLSLDNTKLRSSLNKVLGLILIQDIYEMEHI